MKQRGTPTPSYADQDQQTPLRKYEKVRKIGNGSIGCTSLYRNIEDGKEYAVKEIQLYNMSSKECEAAERGTYLKMLKGPTIVKFHE